MTKTPSDQPLKQVNQRGAARLAAVQALYQMDIGGTGVLEVVAEYEAHRLGQDVDGDTYLKADPSWFRSIVSGVVRDQTKIDPLVRSALLEDWPLSRLDATVRAILRAGTFEILERKDVPVAVIVTEYVEIARAFFEHDEPKLVNAVLDRIAKQVCEHLSYATRVAEYSFRHVVMDQTDELHTLAPGALNKQVRRLLNETPRFEGDGLNIELAGRHFGQVEDVIE